MEVFKDSKTVRSDGGWIPRFLISATVTVVVAVVIALISGCSVYTSNGRKSFEDRSSGNLAKTEIGQSVPAKPISLKADDSDTCWTQPKKEPLWDVQDDEELRVHAINSELIEVCLATET